MAIATPITKSSAAPVGPVTAALRAMRVQPETRPLRERAAALRDRAASLICKLPAPDPHCELLPALLIAYRESHAARPVDWRGDCTPQEQHAAFLTSKRLSDLIAAVLRLPPPRTRESLVALGIAAALDAEGCLHRNGNDEARPLVAVTRTILALTGATLPAEFTGFGDEPDFADRLDASLEGRGSLPAWALEST